MYGIARDAFPVYFLFYSILRLMVLASGQMHAHIDVSKSLFYPQPRSLHTVWRKVRGR